MDHKIDLGPDTTNRLKMKFLALADQNLQLEQPEKQTEAHKLSALADGNSLVVLTSVSKLTVLKSYNLHF